MNQIKNMVDNGNISEAVSKISPEMIENFSKMLANSNSGTTEQVNSQNTNSYDNAESTNSNANSYNNYNSSNTSNNNMNTNTSSQTNNFDFSNIDMNTIMKLSSALGKMNDKNDPRSNLLYSLKPYLRDGRKEKLDQYANLLNMTKIAEVLKENKKENNNG